MRSVDHLRITKETSNLIICSSFWSQLVWPNFKHWLSYFICKPSSWRSLCWFKETHLLQLSDWQRLSLLGPADRERICRFSLSKVLPRARAKCAGKTDCGIMQVGNTARMRKKQLKELLPLFCINWLHVRYYIIFPLGFFFCSGGRISGVGGIQTNTKVSIVIDTWL